MTGAGRALPAVTVLALGGTIASVPAGLRAAGVAPALDAGDLVAAVPALSSVAEVTARSVAGVPGAHLTIDDIVTLAGTVDEEIGAGAVGVVVTQGTDTIEDTAFLLDLLVDGPVPVVVTGAMRNPTLPGADGPANLLAAVAVASAPGARGLGTLVVLNDQVHAARFVRKCHTANPAAFASYPGPVGWLAEGRPHFAVRPIGRRTLPRPRADARHRVALVSLTMGDGGELLAGAIEGGADGVVLEALGGGHVPPGVLDVLHEAARRVPIVLTSTTRTGHVLRSTYDFAGSELDLARAGVVDGGPLDARKSRLLLTLLLRTGTDRDGIAAAFADPWPQRPGRSGTAAASRRRGSPGRPRRSESG